MTEKEKALEEMLATMDEWQEFGRKMKWRWKLEALAGQALGYLIMAGGLWMMYWGLTEYFFG